MSTTQERYMAAIHRIQSIVKFKLSMAGYDSRPHDVVPDTHEASPKHLRVGVESAMASAEALGTLLVEKGVVSQEELAEAITHSLETRADENEARVRDTWPTVRFS